MLGLEPTPEMFVAHLVLVFREVWRVLRDDGVCFLNLGDSYATSGGRGEARMVELGRPSESAITNPLARGNTSGQKGGDNLKPKDLCGIPWRVAFALQADGWWVRDPIVWAKAEIKTDGVPMFDLPITDKLEGSTMPGSQQDRCTSAYELIFQLTKSARYFFDIDAVRTSSGATLRNVWRMETAGYAGAHYAVFCEELPRRCISLATSERGACPECGAAWERVVEKTKPPASVYTKTEKPDSIAPVSHPELGRAGMGQKLQDWYNKHPSHTLGFRPTCDHDAEPVPCLVLDPFAGRGTTAKVARDLGRDCVLLDLSHQYLTENAQTYLELDKLRAWDRGNGRQEANLEGLPMFEAESVRKVTDLTGVSEAEVHLRDFANWVKERAR